MPYWTIISNSLEPDSLTRRRPDERHEIACIRWQFEGGLGVNNRALTAANEFRTAWQAIFRTGAVLVQARARLPVPRFGIRDMRPNL
jgi:hypothetical protein